MADTTNTMFKTECCGRYYRRYQLEFKKGGTWRGNFAFEMTKCPNDKCWTNRNYDGLVRQTG